MIVNLSAEDLSQVEKQFKNGIQGKREIHYVFPFIYFIKSHRMTFNKNTHNINYIWQVKRNSHTMTLSIIYRENPLNNEH